MTKQRMIAILKMVKDRLDVIEEYFYICWILNQLSEVNQITEDEWLDMVDYVESHPPKDALQYDCFYVSSEKDKRIKWIVKHIKKLS